jgi:23S rRNA (adenine2503-C2)-methyltransferase
MMSFYDFTYEKLVLFLTENGFKKFNASQLFEWVYKKRVNEFNKMSNLSQKLIEFLNSKIIFNTLNIVSSQKSDDTIKFLFKLSDDDYIEAVLMKHNYGNSLCVSSEVGCNMGCTFCESGRLKLVRKLQTHEMIEQILLIEKNTKLKINNVVIMGIGEPFDNFENVIDFLNILNDTKALEIGQRRVTVSTCGLVPKIKEFANMDTQVNLAISLHASNDELRNKLMPVNKVYGLNELMKAIDYYIDKTNRRVTIEYIMLEGINDNESNANELIKLFRGKLVYINLIPYNETSHIEFKKTKTSQIMKFYDILKKSNINVTVRREFGEDISAACGQLRAENKIDE